MTMTLMIATLAAAALGPGIANPLDPAAEPTHVAVFYADLDLGSAAGQTALHRRIARAADEACVNAGDGFDSPRAMHEQHVCRARAVLGTETVLAARGLPMLH